MIPVIVALWSLGTPANAEPPPPPFERKHACLMECCSYKKKWEWELLAPKLLKDQPNGKKVGQLHQGEKVRAVDGSVIVQTWRWTARQKSEGIQPGEKFLILGKPKDEKVPVKVHGHVERIKEDFVCAAVGKGESPKREECYKLLYKGPSETWWAKVRHEDGRKGWIRVDQEELKIPDLCAATEEAQPAAEKKAPESPAPSPEPSASK